MSLEGQTAGDFLIDKTFSAKVDYICEETPEPNPCAGENIYLVLAFDKTHVTITEKYISGCDKVSKVSLGKYKWSVAADFKLQIAYKAEKVEYTTLANLVLKLRDKELKGEKVQGNTMAHFTFKEQ